MKQHIASAPLQKIDHINIVVKDLSAAKNFFLDLGFEVLHEGVLKGSWIDKITKLKNVNAQYCALGLGNNQTNLELITYNSSVDQATETEQLPNETGLRHLAFEVANIDSIVTQLKSRKVTFFSEVQAYKASNKKLCYFYGPEGIILELAEYIK